MMKRFSSARTCIGPLNKSDQTLLTYKSEFIEMIITDKA